MYFYPVMALNFFSRHRNIILYGTSIAILSLLLKWLELRLIIFDHAFQLYIGIIALLFTALGIWLALQLARPKVRTIVVEREVYVEKQQHFSVNQFELKKLGLSQRELEVLQLMADGLSNQEIASRLYLSLNTIKTHSSKLFEKMDVERRTQAVDIAKKLGIIP